MRSDTAQAISSDRRAVQPAARPNIQSNVTQFPGSDVPARPYTGGAPYSSFSHSNDGVFANLDAKPERGEKLEEQPPVCLFLRPSSTHIVVY